MNLPEVVKGALFARYSRSAKSLRRLFLDEFARPRTGRSRPHEGADVDIERAEKLYERVFLEYGDDSVAQLGGVHLAVEQASQPADQGARAGPAGGLPRAVHPVHPLRRQARRPLPLPRAGRGRARPALGAPGTARRCDACFDALRPVARAAASVLRERFPQDPADSDWRLPRDDPGEGAATRSRPMLPAATRRTSASTRTASPTKPAAAHARPPPGRGPRVRAT